MENNNTVFLRNIQKKIINGDYDAQLNLPFMSKKLFYDDIKGKIQRRIEKGGTPILTDIEINESIEAVRETAGSIFGVLLYNGILEKSEDGYQLSRKAKIALRLNSKV